MATAKPKVSGYVSQKVKDALRSRVETSGTSESNEIEKILEQALDEYTVMVKLSPETHEELQAWAAAEVRLLEGQITWLVEKAIESRKQNNSKEK